MSTIPYDSFSSVDIRVGRIVQVDDFKRARVPTYKLKIDLGPEIGVKQSSVQAKTEYTSDQLLSRLCLAVVNLEPKNVAGFISEVLVLGVPSGTGGLSLVQPDDDALLGGRLY